MNVYLLLFLPMILTVPADTFKSQVFDVRLIGGNFPGTRTLLTYNNTVISLSRGISSVVDLAGNVLVDGTGLNLTHGLAINGGYFYYSSDTSVYRSNETVKHELVIQGMSVSGNGGAPQGHTTRTLVFQNTTLYVGISSNENVDPDSFRARVRRVDLLNASIPINFTDMEVFADGLRNPLAMAFDGDGRLWELDNGPDSLQRQGFVPDDNPIEELNLLQAGRNYGYPWCFSQGNISKPFENVDSLADGFMDQFSWDTSITADDYCQNPEFNTRPVSGVLAHSSPIQMVFLTRDMGCSDEKEYGRFPCSWVGDIVATLHGSWDRQVPAGYGLIRIPFVNNTPTLPSNHQFIGRVENYQTRCKSGGNTGGSNLRCFRPAGIAVLDGKFYVGSGATGEIVEMLYSSAWELKSSLKFLALLFTFSFLL